MLLEDIDKPTPFQLFSVFLIRIKDFRPDLSYLPRKTRNRA